MFLFGTETFTFEGRLLGTVPLSSVKEHGGERLSSALQLLNFKLDKIHERLVDDTVKTKHGGNSTEALRKKIDKQLRKHGRDVRRGEATALDVTATHVTIKAKWDISVKPKKLSSLRITDAGVLPCRTEKDMACVVFVYEGARAVCHVIAVNKAKSKECCDAIQESIRLARKAKREAEETNVPNPQLEEDSESAVRGSTRSGDSATISFGIGFKRRSSVRVRGGLRRKKSIGLKTGRQASSVSSSSLSSLGSQTSTDQTTAATRTPPPLSSPAPAPAPPAPAAPGLTTAAQAPTPVTQHVPTQQHTAASTATARSNSNGITEAVGSNGPGTFTDVRNDNDGDNSDGDDDDLLADVDEALFNTVDVLEESDVGDMDVDAFGFDDDDDDAQDTAANSQLEQVQEVEEEEEEFGF